MPRRFNYTDRKKIRREDVTIRLRRDGQAIAFDAELRLSDYAFHKIAPPPQVYIEAYRGASTVWKRFAFGHIDTLKAPDNRSLDDFGVPEGILFRVKVSASHGALAGRLLGEADGIRPQLPEEEDSYRQPIINHVPADDIGDELWRVDFAGTVPLLKINVQVPVGVDQFLVDPAFRGVFAPAVMRQVLARALVIDRDSYDDEDEGSWQFRWLQFATSLPDIGDPPEADEDNGRIGNLREIEEWIDRAVEAFVSAGGLLHAFSRAVKPEAGT
jgi:hypothetical protein